MLMDKNTKKAFLFFEKNNLHLDQYNFANLLNVVENAQKSYFNCAKTIIFKNIEKINTNAFSTYIAVQGDLWTNISFKFYKTYKLWWLICKFNNIKNPFQPITAGTLINIPTQKVVDKILNNLKQ